MKNGRDANRPSYESYSVREARESRSGLQSRRARANSHAAFASEHVEKSESERRERDPFASLRVTDGRFRA